MDINRLKRRICVIGKRMHQRKYISGYDGNISVRLGNDRILITPTGVCKGDLEPDMLLELGLSGTILDSPGGFSPTSELNMHMDVYSSREDINGIIHAHPIHATALSLLYFDISTPVLPESLFSFGKIGVADFAIPTTKAVVDSIKPLLQEHDAIILKKHGTITFGKDIMESYYRLESLEHTCEIIYKTSVNGKALPLGHDVIRKIMAIRK